MDAIKPGSRVAVFTIDDQRNETPLVTGTWDGETLDVGDSDLHHEVRYLIEKGLADGEETDVIDMIGGTEDAKTYGYKVKA